MTSRHILDFTGLLAAAFVAFSCADKKPDTPEEGKKVAVESVSVTPEVLALETSRFYDLTATVLPENASDPSVRWSSSNESVVSVDGGSIMTLAPGEAVITVTTNDGGHSAACTVTVTLPLKSISLDPSSADLGVGETLTLSVLYPENATQTPVSWKSSDSSVAEVDGNGLVTALALGSCTITASVPDTRITAACQVTVKKKNLPWVESPDGKSYPAGVTVTRFKDQLDGDNYCQGAIAHIDFSANPDLRFNLLFGSMKTLVSTGPGDDVDWFDMFPEKDGMPVILTNAGFFDSQWGTSSLVGQAGIIKSQGASTTGIPGYSGTYYPVRSALWTDSKGQFHIDWVYPMSDGVYSFPSALDQNDKDGTFLPSAPTKYTSGASKLSYKTLIQGGPRLVKDGRNVAELNTRAELLTKTVGEPHGYRTSRTAIGIKADGSLVIIVCEGDGRSGKADAGFDVCELADKFIELGCVDALGFDGGGSSEMIGPDGQAIAKRISSPRAMPTAICISEIRYE